MAHSFDLDLEREEKFYTLNSLDNLNSHRP